MPTKEQLQEGIRRAHAAGDANAVRVLGNQLLALQKPKAAPVKERFMTFSDAVAAVAKNIPDVAVGIPESAYNIASAIVDPIAVKGRQLLRGETPEKAQQMSSLVDKRTGKLFDATARVFTREPHPIGRDIGRAILPTILPMPGKKLQEGGRIARATYRALQGAAGGAAVREPGEDAVKAPVIGAGANIVLPPIISTLAKPISAVASKTSKYLTGLAKPVEESPIETLGKTAQRRAKRFEELGITNPTTGMITRNPEAFGFERTAASTVAGQNLLSQLHDVERSLISKGRELVESYGGSKGSETVGINAGKFLEAKQEQVQKLTTKLYTEALDARGDETIGFADKLRQSFDDPELADNPVFEDMTAAIGRRLARWADREEGNVTGITLRQANELRKFIGRLGNSTDPTARLSRARLINALDDDVVDAIGDDALKAARDNAKAGFEEFKKTYVSRVMNEGIPAEKVVNHLFSANASLKDFRTFRRSFLTGTKRQVEQGRQIWQQITAQKLNDFFNKAISTEGRLDGGALLRSLSQEGPKLREVLGPKEYKKLENLVVASRDATSPPIGELGDDTAAVTALFQALPERIKAGWINFLTRNTAAHGAAFALGGPVANVGLVGAQNVIGSAVEQRAANIFIRRIQMAQNPQQAAAAITAAKKAAQSNTIIADYLNKSGLVGTTAAAVATGE